MTKAEILEMIEGTAKAQKEALSMVNKILESVSMSEDTVVLASILHTMNGCICDTMNNLSLILCEMLTEELKEAPEPRKGEHSPLCVKTHKHCLCNTCVNDQRDKDEICCVDTHGFGSCPIRECPNYVKEG